MPIIIILFIVALIFMYKFASKLYRKFWYIIHFFFTAIVILMVGSFLKIPDSLYILLNLAAAGFFFGMWFNYKKRAERYINDYLTQYLANPAQDKVFSEAIFLNQPKTRKLLGERYSVDGKTTKEFLQQCLRKVVLEFLKNIFMSKLFNNGQIITDRIFFYNEFYDYLSYLNEQNMELAEVLADFNIVQSGFSYVPDCAFFSNDLLARIEEEFVPFISGNQKLSDVPFSWNYLTDTMVGQDALSPYIAADMVERFKKLEDSDFIDVISDFYELYGCIAEADINKYLEKGKLDKVPNLSYDEKNNSHDIEKYNYSLKHEDENGIIPEEYGMSSEQHRVTFEVDLDSNQLDDLDGCPA